MSLEKVTWYVARSGGIVAWCLLALSLTLGLLLSSRTLGKKASPAWTLSVHRFLGGLGVVFTAIHVIAIMLDDFVDFGFADVLVPFAAAWQPGAVAWGIVAMYLMVAIEVTSLVMNRLPKRLWRWVHWTSAGLFVTATLHGFLAGTDAGRAFIVATIAVMAVLATLTSVRVRRARREVEPRADPRELLEQLREKQARRAKPPEHVLDSLTLTTRPTVSSPRRQPEPAMSSMRSPLADSDHFEWQPSSAATPRGEPAVAAPGVVGTRTMAAAERPTSTAPVAEVSTQPEWDRPTPPPKPPESIEDALPEVPWSMPVPDIGGPSVSPGRWRPRDHHSGDGSDDSGDCSDDGGDGGDGTGDEDRPFFSPSGVPDEAEESTGEAIAEEPDASGAPPTPTAQTTDMSTPATGPPKPNWSDPPDEPARRPGPAPGVWKRQPSPGEGEPPTWG